MPGVAEKDLQVQLNDNRLSVSGKRESEKTEQNETYYASERSYGSFTRAFTLPQKLYDQSLIDLLASPGKRPLTNIGRNSYLGYYFNYYNYFMDPTACTSGTVGGRQVPDYVDEPGVDPARDTETLAEVVLEVNNWRWAGVPFRLRSGKSIGTARKEVVLTFRPAPHVPTGLTGEVAPDRLRLVLNPDAMALEVNVNGENDPMTIDRVSLDTDLSPGRLPAYGEVLAGILDGDPLLAVRGDTAVDCWRIIDPVLAAWRAGQTPLESYPAGSQGPEGWPT